MLLIRRQIVSFYNVCLGMYLPAVSQEVKSKTQTLKMVADSLKSLCQLSHPPLILAALNNGFYQIIIEQRAKQCGSMGHPYFRCTSNVGQNDKLKATKQTVCSSCESSEHLCRNSPREIICFLYKQEYHKQPDCLLNYMESIRMKSLKVINKLATLNLAILTSLLTKKANLMAQLVLTLPTIKHFLYWGLQWCKIKREKRQCKKRLIFSKTSDRF